MATLNSIEVPSDKSGTYESLTLQTAGTWFIKPRCKQYKIIGRLSEGAESIMTQVGAGLNIKVSQADAPLTIYLQASCDENTTAIADYSDFFFEVGASVSIDDAYLSARLRELMKVFLSTEAITTSNLPAGSFGYKLSATTA